MILLYRIISDQYFTVQSLLYTFLVWAVSKQTNNILSINNHILLLSISSNCPDKVWADINQIQLYMYLYVM